MRRLAILGALLLGGCTLLERDNIDTFVVDVGNRDVSTAEAELYGKPKKLLRSGNLLIGSYAIRGDGSGEIRVHFSDGVIVRCPIGYVTHGLPDHLWRYEIKGDRCEQPQAVARAEA